MEILGKTSEKNLTNKRRQQTNKQTNKQTKQNEQHQRSVSVNRYDAKDTLQCFLRLFKRLPTKLAISEGRTGDISFFFQNNFAYEPKSVTFSVVFWMKTIRS